MLPMHISKYSTFQSSLVIHSSLSDPFVKLPDVEGKPQDILSDLVKLRFCLSNPPEFVSDLTVTLTNVNQNVP
jgi:hypothetical protein